MKLTFIMFRGTTDDMIPVDGYLRCILLVHSISRTDDLFTI